MKKTFFVKAQKQIDSLLRARKFSLTQTRALFSLGALMVVATTFGGYQFGPTYQTDIKMDLQNPNLLNIPNQKVEIIQGISRFDMEQLGKTHDPAEIKYLIQEIAPKYGLDWRLVYAIGYLESGNFNSSLARLQNNFFGRKASSGVYASWPNTLVAIENQCEYLKTRYIDRGLDTPYEMNHVYAESGTWGAKVTSIMNSL
jgi:hypothetical protein